MRPRSDHFPDKRRFLSLKSGSDSYDRPSWLMGRASEVHKILGNIQGVSAELAFARAQPDRPQPGAVQREVAQRLSGLSARRAGVLGPGLISSG